MNNWNLLSDRQKRKERGRAVCYGTFPIFNIILYSYKMRTFNYCFRSVSTAVWWSDCRQKHRRESKVKEKKKNVLPSQGLLLSRISAFCKYLIINVVWCFQIFRCLQKMLLIFHRLGPISFLLLGCYWRENEGQLTGNHWYTLTWNPYSSILPRSRHQKMGISTKFNVSLIPNNCNPSNKF